MTDDEIGFFIPGPPWLVSTAAPDFADPREVARLLVRERMLADDRDEVWYVSLLTDSDLADRHAKEVGGHAFRCPDGGVFLQVLWALRDQGVTDVGLDPRKRRGETVATFVKLETLVRRYSGRG
jgi:hypothetical protein